MAPSPPAGARPRSRGDGPLIALILAIPAAVTVWGLPYYLLSRAGRMRSPLHDWLGPSAPVGLGFGVLGFGLFLFMWLYPLRKRFRWLGWTGGVGAWLRVHTLAGLSLPMLLAVHAGWRFDGLIGLGYGAMMLVWASGLVGRYLYTRIPRSRTGLELSLDEVSGERRALITRIAAATRLQPVEIERALAIGSRPDAGRGVLGTVRNMIADDLDRARAVRALRERWKRPRPGERPPDPRELNEALRLARRELALSQQVGMLDASRRVFGYWHVAHRPFAITALLAVLIHVAVAVAVGGVGIR